MILELCKFIDEPVMQQVKSKTEDKVYFKVTVPVTYEANGEYHIINLVAWGNTAKYIVNTFKKGKWAYVTGRLMRNNWKDVNGYNRHDFFILVESMQTLPESKPKPTEQAKDEAIGACFDYGLDDLPPILQD